MKKDDEVKLPPRGKIEWNLNTIVTLVGFAGGLIAWGATLGTFSADMKSLETKLGTYINERSVSDSRVDEWRKGVDGETRKIDNLSYRVTVVEQNAAQANQSLQELKAVVNGQAADIKVMRVILEQMREAQFQKRAPVGN